MNFVNPDTKKQILVASPDSHLLPMLKFLLVADGFRVFVENEIRRAIDSLEWRRPDLVLLDLHVLVKENTSTFSAIREMKSHLPIIFLLEPQFLSMAEQLAKNRTCKFVTKPIDYQELRKYLRLAPAPAPDLNKVLITAQSIAGKTRPLLFDSALGANFASGLRFTGNP